jgi:NitT/TauT family transport system substrate-binding protein
LTPVATAAASCVALGGKRIVVDAWGMRAYFRRATPVLRFSRRPTEAATLDGRAAMSTQNLNRRSCLRIAAGGCTVALLPMASVWARGQHGSAAHGVAGVDTMYSMVYATMKLGFFAAEGLDVEHINSQSGPRAKQMLAAGQVLIATAGINDSVALSLAGKPSTVVFSLDRRVPLANILVHKDNLGPGKLQTVADLAGKTIAVTQPQSTTWLMAMYLADRFGIQDKLTIRGLGDSMTMLGAVKSKQVDATIATLSMMDAAVQEGWGAALFDVTDEATWKQVFGGDVPGLGCYVLSALMDQRGPAIQAFVNAMVMGSDWVRARSPEALVELIGADYLSGLPQHAVLRAVASYKKSLWNFSNVLDKAGYDRLMAIMGDGRQFSHEELRRVPYDKAVDMRFVRHARHL